jgi:hypothetical protein
MVVPYGDPTYYQLRPKIAIERGLVLQLPTRRPASIAFGPYALVEAVNSRWCKASAIRSRTSLTSVP